MYTKEFISRFWSKVDIRGPEECWPWKASLRNGYGQIHVCRVEGKIVNHKAHRVAYNLEVGYPGSLCVCHRCDNPICCNPEHLFLGTQKDNIHDMLSKGRCLDHPGAPPPKKYYSVHHKVVCRLNEAGKSQREIASITGIPRSSVRRILGLIK